MVDVFTYVAGALLVAVFTVRDVRRLLRGARPIALPSPLSEAWRADQYRLRREEGAQ